MCTPRTFTTHERTSPREAKVLASPQLLCAPPRTCPRGRRALASSAWQCAGEAPERAAGARGKKWFALFIAGLHGRAFFFSSRVAAWRAPVAVPEEAAS